MSPIRDGRTLMRRFFELISLGIRSGLDRNSDIDIILEVIGQHHNLDDGSDWLSGQVGERILNEIERRFLEYGNSGLH